MMAGCREGCGFRLALQCARDSRETRAGARFVRMTSSPKPSGDLGTPFSAIFLAYPASAVRTVPAMRERAMSQYPELCLLEYVVRIPFDNAPAAALRGRVSLELSRAEAVVAFVGGEATTDDWVVWEMREGVRLGLPVIALVLPHARRSGVVPRDLADVPLIRGSLGTAIRALEPSHSPGDGVDEN